MKLKKETIIDRIEKLKTRAVKKESEAKKVMDACHKVNQSWSGSSLVGHAKFYYKDFEEPNTQNRFSIEWGLIHGIPDGWEEKNDDDVRKKIEELSCNNNLDEIKNLATKLEQEFTDVQRQTVLDLAEVGVLETSKIENFTIKSATNHFNEIFPTKFMTRDSQAITGHYIVTHIYYQAIAMFIKGLPSDLDSFIFEVNKLYPKDNVVERESISPKLGYYIENTTILRLQNINSDKYDLSRLIKLCKELNDNYSLENFLACGMIIRSILDHIPPKFGKNNFTEVCSQYGQKSFKDIIKPLQESSRKIFDTFLHSQMRKKETLPTKTQVSFQPNIDYLLNEIVRILEESHK